MKLTIISGRSGSGKSTALKALEDAGFNCIDNFPVALLGSLIEGVTNGSVNHDGLASDRYAVCIDARATSLAGFPEVLRAVDRTKVDIQVIYLDALTGTLVKRFSETRRRHPLTDANTDLLQAIDDEKDLLSSIANLADLTIDTTHQRGSELTETIRTQVARIDSMGITLLFRSFGYKFGVPVDADLVFDLRCLPNPYWHEHLRGLSGLDTPVVEFLNLQPQALEMFEDIQRFLARWVPRFEDDNRAYLTIAVGCTGGQHRSVYMVEKLKSAFTGQFGDALVRHRELRPSPGGAQQ